MTLKKSKYKISSPEYFKSNNSSNSVFSKNRVFQIYKSSFLFLSISYNWRSCHKTNVLFTKLLKSWAHIFDNIATVVGDLQWNEK